MQIEAIYQRFHFSRANPLAGNDRIVQNKCKQLYRWTTDDVSWLSFIKILNSCRGRFCDPLKLAMTERSNRIASRYLKNENQNKNVRHIRKL